MDDNTLMPFGKYKGTNLANVPANYLLWLEKEIRKKSKSNHSATEAFLLKYIEENKDVLDNESSEKSGGDG